MTSRDTTTESSSTGASNAESPSRTEASTRVRDDASDPGRGEEPTDGRAHRGGGEDGRATASDEASAPTPRTAVETSVPAGAPAFVCEHCGRAFADESLRTLHRGLAHWGALDDAGRAAYREATAAEAADLRRFRIVALGVLVLLYFGLLFAYAAFA